MPSPSRGLKMFLAVLITQTIIANDGTEIVYHAKHVGGIKLIMHTATKIR